MTTADSSPLQLRPATVDDTDFLAWGLNEAGGGLFGTLFGAAAPAILAKVIAQPKHAFSFEHAVVAEQAGEVVGFCQGFPYGTPTGTAAIAKAAGVRTARAAVIGLLGLPLVNALDRHAPGEGYLQAVAVAPAGRGAGVGSTLFADAFRRAAHAGCSTLTLDVDTANVRAVELYERLGLAVENTSGKAVLLGGVQVHRMTARVPPASA